MTPSKYIRGEGSDTEQGSDAKCEGDLELEREKSLRGDGSGKKTIFRRGMHQSKHHNN